MPVTKTQTIITIDTYQRTLIRSRRMGFVAWCDLCGRETLMLSPEQAAIMRRATERLIYRQIESGQLHAIERTNGSLLICSGSIELADAP